MILVLKGADFSANNIGKIDLPQDLTPRQKEMLAKYTKPLTIEQQLGFGSFMNTLEKNNILPKIKGLFLPILAGDTSEAFINLATQDLSTEFVPDSSKCAIDNGIKNTNLCQFKPFNTNSIEVKNCHILYHQSNINMVYGVEGASNQLAYIIDATIKATTIINPNQLPKDNTFYWQRTQIENINLGVGSGNNSYTLSQGLTGLYGFSIANGKFVYHGTSVSKSDIALDSSVVSQIESMMLPKISITGNVHSHVRRPLQYFSYGEGLSADEWSIMNNAFADFMNLFGIV